MRKTLNIFVLGCLLLSTALANVTLFKCIDGGDLCFTKSCCEEVTKSSPCCSEHPVEAIMEDTCCDEVAIVIDKVIIDYTKTKIKSVSKSFDFDLYTYSSPLKKSLVNNDIIRGPPAGSSRPFLSTVPVHIKNCSFLC